MHWVNVGHTHMKRVCGKRHAIIPAHTVFPWIMCNSARSRFNISNVRQLIILRRVDSMRLNGISINFPFKGYAAWMRCTNSNETHFAKYLLLCLNFCLWLGRTNCFRSIVDDRAPVRTAHWERVRVYMVFSNIFVSIEASIESIWWLFARCRIYWTWTPSIWIAEQKSGMTLYVCWFIPRSCALAHWLNALVRFFSTSVASSKWQTCTHL